MTLHAAYTQMAAEPWCMRPWELARLTDFQIDHLYRLPAEKRARETEERLGRARPMPTTVTEPVAARAAPAPHDPPPDRAALIDLLVKWGNRTPARAAREADERLANWTPDPG